MSFEAQCCSCGRRSKAGRVDNYGKRVGGADADSTPLHAVAETMLCKWLSSYCKFFSSSVYFFFFHPWIVHKVLVWQPLIVVFTNSVWGPRRVDPCISLTYQLIVNSVSTPPRLPDDTTEALNDLHHLTPALATMGDNLLSRPVSYPRIPSYMCLGTPIEP